MPCVLWKNVAVSAVGMICALQMRENAMISDTYAFALSGLCLVIIMASTPATWVKAPKLADTLLPQDLEAMLVGLDRRLDEYKVFGTHNSTHVCNALAGLILPMWQYTHPPILQQLESGLRALEIDIWYNRRAHRWEVRHENLIDSLTVADVHYEFLATMKTIREWSRSTPQHFPLIINLDIKGSYTPGLGWAAPLIGRGLSLSSPHTKAAYDRLQHELLQAWEGQGEILTPRCVVSAGPDGMPLRHHIKEHGWPGVQSMGGKTLFFLNLYGDRKDGFPHADDSFFFVRGHCHETHLHSVYFESPSPNHKADGHLLRMLHTRKSDRFDRMMGDAHMVAVDDISLLNASIVPLGRSPTTPTAGTITRATTPLLACGEQLC